MKSGYSGKFLLNGEDFIPDVCGCGHPQYIRAGGIISRYLYLFCQSADILLLSLYIG